MEQAGLKQTRKRLMLRSYLLPIVGFGMTFASSVVAQEQIEPPSGVSLTQQAKPAPDSEKTDDNSVQAATDEDDQARKLTDDDDVITLAKERDAETDVREPDDEAINFARRELAAQQTIAEFTRQMAYAAWIAIALTLLGIYLIARTLVATREAAKYTKIAAGAAEAAVVKTRRIGEAQTRAYLNIISASYEAHDDRFYVFISIKNSGPTPGNITSIHYALYRGGVVPDQPEMAGPFEPADTSVTQVVAAADVEKALAVWTHETIGEADFSLIFQEVPNITLVNDIVWSDVFKRKQKSRFLLAVDRKPNEKRSTRSIYRGRLNVQYVYTHDHDF